MLDGPHNMETPYVMHTNIPNILKLDSDQYQWSPFTSHNNQLFDPFFKTQLPNLNHFGNSSESPIFWALSALLTVSGGDASSGTDTIKEYTSNKNWFI